MSVWDEDPSTQQWRSVWDEDPSTQWRWSVGDEDPSNQQWRSGGYEDSGGVVGDAGEQDSVVMVPFRRHRISRASLASGFRLRQSRQAVTAPGKAWEW